jgi:predicted transcriptional regulator
LANKTIYMEFREIIEEKGLKIIFLAKKLGVSQPLFSMYLAGKRNMPLHIREKLTELLN